MLYSYLIFSLSLSITSWIVGIIIHAMIKNTKYYKKNLVTLNFITSEKTNKKIGIGAFKWIVKNTFFKYLNQKLKIKIKIEKASLINLRNEMTNSEIHHLIGFVFVTLFAFIKIFNSHYLLAVLIMIVNILLNLYPSLLQQQNKRQIDQILKKL